MQDIKEYFNNKIDLLKSEFLGLAKTTIAIVQLGETNISKVYIKNIITDAELCGIECKFFTYPKDTTENGLLYVIQALNKDPMIDGIIVQMPLPEWINQEVIRREINPKKDMDGLNQYSLCKSAMSIGIYNYLVDNNYEFSGKNAVILGRSNIVGTHMYNILLNANMNVTILNSKISDKDKKLYIKNADLIISSVGQLHIITKEYKFKEDVVIFDVGINLNEENKLCGDCDYNDIVSKVNFISPVPDGVDLLSRIALLSNILILKKNKYLYK